MARKLEVVITGDASSLSRALKQADKAASRFGAGIGRFGKVAAAGFAIAGAAAGAAGVKMIGMASDAAEVQSKMEVVFGKALPALTKNIDAFSAATGASRYELREQVADMGALLEPLTANKLAAADMSEQFVKLATDLGSFNNVPVEDALLAIRSGLVGESEPLRRFGVLLNAAAVEAKALEMGLAKNKKELTEQNKVQARAALIMEQTTLAQGDATRTAGSMANQIKRLKNSVSDLGTDIGKVLLPPALRLLKWINGFIEKMKAADSVGAAFKTAIGELGNMAGRMLSGLIKSIRNIDWVAVAGALAAGFRQAMDRVWGGGNTSASGNPMQRTMDNGIKGAVDGIDWDELGRKIGDGIRVGVSNVGELTKTLVDVINRATKKIPWEDIGRQVGPGLAAAFVVAFSTLMDPAFWARNWDLALSVAIVAFRAKLAGFAGKIAGKFVDDIASALSRVAPRLGDAFRGLAIQAVRFFGVGLEGAGRMLGPVVSRIFGKLATLAVFTARVLGVQYVINQVSALYQKIRSLAQGADTWLTQAGRDVLQGLWDGMVAVWNQLKSWWNSAVDAIPLGLGKKLKISSPSVVMYDMGRDIVRGLLNGMEIELPKLTEKSQKLADRIIDGLESRKQAVVEAMSRLASATLAAFDDVTAKWQSPTEKLLAKMDTKAAVQRLNSDIADAKEAIRQAQTDLAAAQAAPTLSPDGDPAQQQQAIEDAKRAVEDAEERLGEARVAKQRYYLEKKAEKERAAHEEERATKRVRLEKELETLAAGAVKLLGRHDLTQKQILALLQKKVPSFRKRGFELADAIRLGLEDATSGVVSAAEALARAMAKALQVKGEVEVDKNTKAGKRAMGGPVRMGQAYVVGERGPELFVPGMNGTIVPNLSAPAAYGGTGGATTITVNLPNYLGSPQEVAQVIRRELIQIGRRNGSALGGLA